MSLVVVKISVVDLLVLNAVGGLTSGCGCNISSGVVCLSLEFIKNGSIEDLP